MLLFQLIVFQFPSHTTEPSCVSLLQVEELVPGSEVYIEKSVLGSIRKSAKTHSGVARTLLMAVFEKSALLKCSILGKANKQGGPSRRALNIRGVYAVIGE